VNQLSPLVVTDAESLLPQLFGVTVKDFVVPPEAVESVCSDENTADEVE